MNIFGKSHATRLAKIRIVLKLRPNKIITSDFRYVELPDGRIQRVRYTVNKYSGFVAEITYEGQATTPKYEPHPKYVPRPYYY